MMSLSSMRRGSVSHLSLVPSRHGKFGWGRHGIPSTKAAPWASVIPPDAMTPWGLIVHGGGSNCNRRARRIVLHGHFLVPVPGRSNLNRWELPCSQTGLLTGRLGPSRAIGLLTDQLPI